MEKEEANLFSLLILRPEWGDDDIDVDANAKLSHSLQLS